MWRTTGSRLSIGRRSAYLDWYERAGEEMNVALSQPLQVDLVDLSTMGVPLCPAARSKAPTGQGLCILHDPPTPVEYTLPSSSSPGLQWSYSRWTPPPTLAARMPRPRASSRAPLAACLGLPIRVPPVVRRPPTTMRTRPPAAARARMAS